jgi:hypothetical protein
MWDFDLMFCDSGNAYDPDCKVHTNWEFELGETCKRYPVANLARTNLKARKRKTNDAQTESRDHVNG